MSTQAYRIKLSKGSLLLLHLADAGHVWRSGNQWVASTTSSKRNVTLRIDNLINRGFMRATFEDNFLTITDLGRRYMADHPVEEMLSQILR
jgi:hypothetical protein